MQKKRFERITEFYHLAVSLDGITCCLQHRRPEAPLHHPFSQEPDTIIDILSQGLITP